MQNTYMVTFTLGFHKGSMVVDAISPQDAINLVQKDYDGFTLKSIKATKI
jgi:hypothetical protein